MQHLLKVIMACLYSAEANVAEKYLIISTAARQPQSIHVMSLCECVYIGIYVHIFNVTYYICLNPILLFSFNIQINSYHVCVSCSIMSNSLQPSWAM